jgi:copper(I)-binding protein
VLASLVAAACAAVPGLTLAQTVTLVVQNAWIRKPPPGVDTAAVYFTLKNPSPQAVVIVGISSPVAAHAMVHETSTVDGQSRMRMRDRVTVPGGTSRAFAPEGLHVMLSGLSKALEVGDEVPLTLELDHGGSISTTAIVRPLDAQ